MPALLVLIPSALILLWLVSIRPYCRKHKQGYTTGANWGVTIWVDWQQAGEIARKQGDGGMIVVCRLFLFLQIAFVLAFAWLVAVGA